MNMCDNPKQVSIAQIWREGDIINRVPIIVTGNDFSTLFAPLVGGRMPGGPDSQIFSQFQTPKLLNPP